MSTTIWASARVLEWVRQVARAEGIDPSLFEALPQAKESARVPLAEIEAACTLLEELLGGPAALLEAARRAPVSPELSLTSTAETSDALIACFFEILVPSLLPGVAVLHARERAGEDVEVLTTDGPVAPALACLLGGIAAALPRARGLVEGSVHLDGERTARLTLVRPPTARSEAVSARSPTISAVSVGAVFNDLLEDRAHYQEDLQRGERAMARLAESLYAATDLFELARRTAETLHAELALPFVLVWAQTTGDSPHLLASVGTRTGEARLVPLRSGERHLGLIEATDTPAAHWLDALAPWIAAEIARYTEATRPRTQAIPEPPARWGLTRRQREIAMLVATGATTNEIAASLGSSPRTVEEHVGSCLKKAGVPNRATLAARMFDEAEGGGG